MIKDWNLQDLCRTIGKITFNATDPRMDGFNTWACKRELYELLFFVQEQLDKCSTYGDMEEEYLKKHDQEKMLKALGKK
jgi:hypothetical protein